MIAAVLEWVVLSALVVTAICLQTIPITPIYDYPDSVAMDAPRREEVAPGWAIFLILLVVSAVFSLGIWDRATVPLPQFLQVIGALIAALSISSILCSAVHILVATPRPDSIAQCGTVNVSYQHCAQVLSRSRLASQFRSFPAWESAAAMATAVMLTVVVDVLLTDATPFVLIFKSLVIACPILMDALLLATGCYRIPDVVAGALLGFLVAYVGAQSLMCQLQNSSKQTSRPTESLLSLSHGLVDSVAKATD
jgi:hypothetical protein